MNEYPPTSNEILLKLSQFDIERRKYNVPGRGEVQREVVTHPGSVLIIPLLDDGTVVMIHNYRYTAEQELLELPAGTIEPPESTEDCALRELKEETGYIAEQAEYLCRFYTTPGYSNEMMYVYAAENLEKAMQEAQGGEQIRVSEMPLSEALSACKDGRIIDGKTIAALTMYHLGRKGSP